MEDLSTAILLASASYDERILVWDLKKGKPVKTLSHDGSQVNSMKISPDRKKLACAGNPLIRIFDIENSSKTPLLKLGGHTGNVVDIEYERKMRFLVSASEDSTVKLWDIRARGAQRDYYLKSEVNSMALHPNQAEIICACHDGHLRVIDLVANKVITYLPVRYRPFLFDINVEQGDHDVHLRTVAVSPAGDCLTFTADSGDLFTWKTDKVSAVSLEPAAIQRVPAHSSMILRCRFNPDGSMFATAASDGLVMLWDTKSWKEIKTLDGHREYVWDIAFASGSDMSVILWDIPAGLAAKKFQGHQRAVSALAFNDNIPLPPTLAASQGVTRSESSTNSPSTSLPATPEASMSSLPSIVTPEPQSSEPRTTPTPASTSTAPQTPSSDSKTTSTSNNTTPSTGDEGAMKRSTSSKRIVVKKIVVDKKDL